MNAKREKIAWHQIFEDDDIVLKFEILGGMSSLALLTVTLLTAYGLEHSLIPA